MRVLTTQSKKILFPSAPGLATAWAAVLASRLVAVWEQASDHTSAVGSASAKVVGKVVGKVMGKVVGSASPKVAVSGLVKGSEKAVVTEVATVSDLVVGLETVMAQGLVELMARASGSTLDLVRALAMEVASAKAMVKTTEAESASVSAVVKALVLEAVTELGLPLMERNRSNPRIQKNRCTRLATGIHPRETVQTCPLQGSTHTFRSARCW